jgi:hypothetical protein
LITVCYDRVRRRARGFHTLHFLMRISRKDVIMDFALGSILGSCSRTDVVCPCVEKARPLVGYVIDRLIIRVAWNPKVMPG